MMVSIGHYGTTPTSTGDTTNKTCATKHKSITDMKFRLILILPYKKRLQHFQHGWHSPSSRDWMTQRPKKERRRRRRWWSLEQRRRSSWWHQGRRGCFGSPSLHLTPTCPSSASDQRYSISNVNLHEVTVYIQPFKFWNQSAIPDSWLVFWMIIFLTALAAHVRIALQIALHRMDLQPSLWNLTLKRHSKSISCNYLLWWLACISFVGRTLAFFAELYILTSKMKETYSLSAPVPLVAGGSDDFAKETAVCWFGKMVGHLGMSFSKTTRLHSRVVCRIFFAWNKAMWESVSGSRWGDNKQRWMGTFRDSAGMVQKLAFGCH